jgi:hypothetical protein
MSKFAALDRELDELERLLTLIRGVTSERETDRRRELVRLRRSLSMQIAAVGRVAETAFKDTAEYQTYKEKFSQMRSSAALHQAKWPAVLVGERETEFDQSAAPMREANRAFIEWVRQARARLG